MTEKEIIKPDHDEDSRCLFFAFWNVLTEEERKYISRDGYDLKKIFVDTEVKHEKKSGNSSNDLR